MPSTPDSNNGNNGNNGNHRSCRIVLTGGPGGGKTTAADLLRRELGDEVVMVPEAATLLFSGGFPRHADPLAVRATQRAIFHVQRGLEDTQAAKYSDRILLCDRGTVDGQAYWPLVGDEFDDFFVAQHTTLAKEFARYDAVLFFETAAAGELAIDSNNPIRVENLEQARALDTKLHNIWGKHPKFVFISHNASFFKKITFALAILEGLIRELRWERRPK